jgi:transposase-like protein
VRASEQPYRSTLMDFLRGNSDVLEHLVVQMYTRGLSTRDIEDALRDPVTGETLLSKSAASDLTDRLWDDYLAFCQRDLSAFPVEYVFIDGLYEGMRLHKSRKEAILVAWGVLRDGRKVLLHLALGNKESEVACTAFVRDMVKRGLPVPTLVTTDGAPALIAAVEAIWPHSLRQRCLVHKVRNVLDRVPVGVKDEVKQALWSVYRTFRTLNKEKRELTRYALLVRWESGARRGHQRVTESATGSSGNRGRDMQRNRPQRDA